MDWSLFTLKLNGYDPEPFFNDLENINDLNPTEYRNRIEKLKWQIFKHHQENNPYFQLKIKDLKINKWEDIPISDKSDLQKPLNELLSHGYHPSNVYQSSTSGSSGNPMFFAKNKECQARTWAFVIHRYKKLGIWNNGLEARFYGIPQKFTNYYFERIKDYFLGRYRFPVFDLSDKNLQKFTKIFSKKKITYINGYTNSIVTFCQYLLKNNLTLSQLQPNLKCIILTSELCTLVQREIVESAAKGISIYSEYGSSEFGYLGIEERFGYWRIIEENVFVEIIPKKGLDNDIGELIVTDLHNLAFPFIRFRLGDIGKITLDENGRSYLSNLLGRTNDLIYLPSGKIAAGMTFYYISREILEKKIEIIEFIVKQVKLDLFIFEYVAKTELSNWDKEFIQNQFNTYLEDGLNVNFKKITTIEKLKSGKLKHFYSELNK